MAFWVDQDRIPCAHGHFLLRSVGRYRRVRSAASVARAGLAPLGLVGRDQLGAIELRVQQAMIAELVGIILRKPTEELQGGRLVTVNGVCPRGCIHRVGEVPLGTSHLRGTDGPGDILLACIGPEQHDDDSDKQEEPALALSLPSARIAGRL